MRCSWKYFVVAFATQLIFAEHFATDSPMTEKLHASWVFDSLGARMGSGNYDQGRCY